MNTDELANVIDRLRENPRDHDNWADLHRLLWPFLVTKMYRKLGANRYLAEEVAQEALIRMIRSFDFQGLDVTAAKFMKYLGASCNSVLVDMFRAKTRRLEISPDDSSVLLGDFEDKSPDPQEAAILRDTLNRLLESLPAQEREVTGWLLKGYSSQSISEKMNLSRKTVNNVVSIIRKKFRSAFFMGSG